MYIRKSEKSDLETIKEIYSNAKLFMRANGNMNQWINGYPSDELILQDIADGDSYLCLEDDEAQAVFVYKRGIDPTYLRIDGQWLNDEEYGVIHRIASRGKIKGTGTFCLNYGLQQCPNLRIDTHADNRPMQNLLNKEGFTYCGIIYLENGDPRMAFHKKI
ncbi:MAG: GNAT family N-acetyltransferase [Erysipelotrichaceae bacterium]|nr:GNAT family N-acetyltransferase [Erysipelotrichaceae bacterium]MBR3150798.1 GNAT family N-acetyltransferase [Erysipelotrichaceae bacterium]MBR3167762.1 GNAT family N-acetyltransferase [Erysipelotrichaceae bacterium]